MRFFLFRKRPFSSANGSSLSTGSLAGASVLSSSATLVVRRDFGRQHLGREIERHARFRFGLVLREPLLHQLAEFRIAAFQVADRFRFEGEQAAVAERLDRRRARRAVQDREFAEEIALAIEGEIVLRAIVGRKARARPFSRMNIGPAHRLAG